MDYELNNISKIDSYAIRVQIINKLLENGNYDDAMKAVRALVEASAIVVIKKIHNKDVQNNNLSILALCLAENGEEELSIALKDINGCLNYIYEKKVNVSLEDVEDMLLKLDGFIGKIVGKYKEIFS